MILFQYTLNAYFSWIRTYLVLLQKSMPQLVKNMRIGYTFYHLSSETGSSREKDAQVKISDGLVTK